MPTIAATAGPLRIPIAEQITRNVMETLQRITQLNGYHVTLAKVERMTHKPNTPAQFLAVLAEGDDEEQSDDDTAMGDKAWTRPYEVLVYVFESDLDDPALYAETINNIRADLHKAIMADVTRGGWAQNTEVHNPETLRDPNEPGGIVFPFDVDYRHAENDPCIKTPNGAT